MNAVFLCQAEKLEDGGPGFRFSVRDAIRTLPAFAVRYAGKPHAYLNQCAHVAMEMDWREGQFFDETGLYLMCATHGAVYEPETGRCISGPCRGASLRVLRVTERGGAIYWIPGDGLSPVLPD